MGFENTRDELLGLLELAKAAVHEIDDYMSHGDEAEDPSPIIEQGRERALALLAGLAGVDRVDPQTRGYLRDEAMNVARHNANPDDAWGELSDALEDIE